MRLRVAILSAVFLVGAARAALAEDVPASTEDAVTSTVPKDSAPADAPVAPEAAAGSTFTASPEAPAAATGTESPEALAAAAVVEAPAASAIPPSVNPPDGKAWGIVVGGYLQADGVVVDQSSQDQLSPTGGDVLNTQRFLIRRARLRVEAQRRALGAVIELDANTVKGMAAGLSRAELALGRVRPDWDVELALGLLRIPFGLEVQEAEPDRLFLERSSVSRALFPGNYDLGARARASWRFLRAQVAVMNGNPPGDASFPARDPNAAKDLIGRLGVDSTVADRVRIRVGLSTLKGTGLHSGTPATKDVLFWRDQNEDGLVQQSEIQVIPGRAAAPSRNFSRFAVGADGQVGAAIPHLGRLGLFGEVVWAANLDRALLPSDPIASGRDLRQFGWVVGASQEVTTRAALGVRYDFYNPDLDGFRQTPTAIASRDMSFRTWTFTLSWGGIARDRLLLEYQHNHNALAVAADGSPTTLAADTLTLRGQMVFP